ncbi:MAG: SLATT domain-containing protein [Flavobacteriales bacterium]|nr:SLATT domain-containing protein [Flavobacteriales bacterium]
MTDTRKKIKRIRVDALYGKKKHFNAADRKEKYHKLIGIPLILINVLTGSALFYLLTDGASESAKYISLGLALLASFLSAFQTFFNYSKQVEGHRRVANNYLAIMKKSERLIAYLNDGLIDDKRLVEGLESIGEGIDLVNKEAESFPTSSKDYQLAKQGISEGEENYTETELEI